MSTFASIDVKLGKKGTYLITVFSILNELEMYGWSYVNNGKVFYLPLGDKDEFNWQRDELSDMEILDIIEKKEELKEVIGVELIWKDSRIGVTMLVHSELDLSFSLTTNRKKLVNNITDINWYLEKILVCLENDLMFVETFSFSQC